MQGARILWRSSTGKSGRELLQGPLPSGEHGHIDLLPSPTALSCDSNGLRTTRSRRGHGTRRGNSCARLLSSPKRPGSGSAPLQREPAGETGGYRWRGEGRAGLLNGITYVLCSAVREQPSAPAGIAVEHYHQTVL